MEVLVMNNTFKRIDSCQNTFYDYRSSIRTDYCLLYRKRVKKEKREGCNPPFRIDLLPEKLR